MPKIYEFAIKKDNLNSNKSIFTPVCRNKSKLEILNIFPNPWNRITKIYNEYILMELDFTPDLSYEECEQHIKGYQEILLQNIENQIATVEFHAFEEKEI